MEGSGNINYSLNKNNFYKIISASLFTFLPFYYIVIFISLLYLYTVRYQKYFFSDRIKEYRTDIDTEYFFKSLSYNSPLKIITLSVANKEGDKYIGFTNNSYFILIITYIIALIIILEGLLKNLIYSIYVNIIQINSNNNPYKNNNCIRKISELSIVSISKNYIAISSLSSNYLFPFIVIFLMRIINFDSYDVKHSKWFNYIILFLVFYPFIINSISRIFFYKQFQIFPNLERFLDVKDNYFIKVIKEDFNFKISSVIIFILIIFIYCYYTFIYSDFKYKFRERIIIYIIIFLILFILIPSFFLSFGLSSVLNNKNMNNNSEDQIINNIRNNGLSGLYDLLVKYNYPCFLK
jgi:hypothetical protein